MNPSQYYARTLGAAPAPTYKPAEFDRMVQDQHVDCVIVTAMDRTHHRYIILIAYAPWEGFRIAFNGSQGRLEYEVHENTCLSGASDDTNRPEVRHAQGAVVHETASVLIRPHWGRPVEVQMLNTTEGGHGGGDKRMLDDVFIGGGEDPLGRAANHVAGAMSILTGIAANRSFATGLPVYVPDLVRF